MIHDMLENPDCNFFVNLMMQNLGVMNFKFWKLDFMDIPKHHAACIDIELNI